MIHHYMNKPDHIFKTKTKTRLKKTAEGAINLICDLKPYNGGNIQCFHLQPLFVRIDALLYIIRL